MFRSSLRWLAPPTADSIVKTLAGVLGQEPMPLAKAQSNLPYEVQEELGESYGGLLAFARQNANRFWVSKNGSGIWMLQNAGGGTGSTVQSSYAPSPTAATPRVATAMPSAPPAPSAPGPEVAIDAHQHDTARLDLPFYKVKRHKSVLFNVGGRAFTLPTFAVPLAVVMEVTKSPTADALLEALRPSIESGAVVVAKGLGVLYVAPMLGAGEERNASYDAFKVEGYDLCRLARFLSCEEGRSAGHLHVAAGAILTRPVAQVMLSFPNRISCVFGDTDWDAVLDEEVDVAASAGAKASSSTPSDPLEPTDKTAGLVALLVHGTYLVNPTNMAREAPCALMFADFTLAQMMEEMVAFNKRGDKKTFKAIKVRRRIIRAIIAKRFPLGNPFIDADVSAMLIYDQIEHIATFVPCNVVRELLPEAGKIGCQTGNDFFKAFPNLFNVTEKSTTDVYIQRADCGPPVSENPLTPADLILIVSSALPQPLIANKFFSPSFLKGRFTRFAINEIERHFGGLERMLLLFPKYFDSRPRSGSNETLFATCPKRLFEWEQLALKELQAKVVVPARKVEGDERR